MSNFLADLCLHTTTFWASTTSRERSPLSPPMIFNTRLTTYILPLPSHERRTALLLLLLLPFSPSKSWNIGERTNGLSFPSPLPPLGPFPPRRARPPDIFQSSSSSSSNSPLHPHAKPFRPPPFSLFLRTEEKRPKKGIRSSSSLIEEARPRWSDECDSQAYSFPVTCSWIYSSNGKNTDKIKKNSRAKAFCPLPTVGRWWDTFPRPPFSLCSRRGGLSFPFLENVCKLSSLSLSSPLLDSPLRLQPRRRRRRWGVRRVAKLAPGEENASFFSPPSLLFEGTVRDLTTS